MVWGRGRGTGDGQTEDGRGQAAGRVCGAGRRGPRGQGQAEGRAVAAGAGRRRPGERRCLWSCRLRWNYEK